MTTHEDECQSKLKKKLKGDEKAEGSKMPMKVDMATKKQEVLTTVERKMANSSKDVEGKSDSTKETRNGKKNAQATLERKMANSSKDVEGKSDSTKETRNDKKNAQATLERKMANSSKDVEGKSDSTKKTRNDKKKALIPAMTLDEFFEEYGVEELNEEDEEDKEYEDTCDDQDTSSQDKETETTKKKTRGPTLLMKVHDMKEKIELTWRRGKPIGPTRQKVLIFSRFLGTLARDSSSVTLLYTDWQAVPDENKNKMFVYAKQKCNVPKDGEPWVIATIAEAWKQFKKRIKELHYTPYQTFREMLKNRPTTISEDHFRKLVRFWNFEVTSAITKKNTENRSKQKCNHRMGPVNFELVRAELRAKKENNEEPSQAKMFIATRTNKKGEPLHSSTQEMIDHVNNLKEAGHSDDETFDVLFGKEKYGRVRLYGRGVTKTSLKKDKEIEQLKQQHAKEISSVQNSFDRRMDGITSLLKGLFQQVNPSLSSEQLQAMIETAQKSIPDAISEPNEVRKNVPPSSGSSYMPNNDEE